MGIKIAVDRLGLGVQGFGIRDVCSRWMLCYDQDALCVARAFETDGNQDSKMQC